MGSPLALDPKQCLLGTFPDVLDKFTKIFLQETLFSARKTIARKWMRPEPPNMVDWKRDVNMSLPYKKKSYTLIEVAQPNIIEFGIDGYRNLFIRDVKHLTSMS